MLKSLVLCVILTGCAFAATDESAVRELIARRNAAYHNLDAKTLASLETPDFQLVDRFGDSIASEGPEYNERMWSWTFREVYQANPPEHTIIGIRFLTPDVAIAQTTTEWLALKLDDGTAITAPGEVDTFTVVRKDNSWRIAVQTIHNRFGQGLGDHPDFRTPLHAANPR